MRSKNYRYKMNFYSIFDHIQRYIYIVSLLSDFLMRTMYNIKAFQISRVCQLTLFAASKTCIEV